MNAAQAGEAAGRWFGPGAEALGLITGQAVERGPMTRCTGSRPAPGEKLGRARGNYATTRPPDPADVRRAARHGRAHARAGTRGTPPDQGTRAVHRRDSQLQQEHQRAARIDQGERPACPAGRGRGAAAYWDGREEAFQEVLQAANRAALEHAQKWAGVTRTGYHGPKVNGQETGRFEQARVIVSSWLQGTSRDGDPQDHEHNQFARLVQTISDGKWRALDTVSLRAQLPAMQAIAAAHAECGLAREFGVDWIARADGAGNEIRGVTQAQMDAYSSRTEAIREATPAAVASWTARYGRAPNQRELLHIQQVVTLGSRERKDDTEIDWDAYAARWDATLGGQLASVAPPVSSLRGPGKRAADRG